MRAASIFLFLLAAMCGYTALRLLGSAEGRAAGGDRTASEIAGVIAPTVLFFAIGWWCRRRARVRTSAVPATGQSKSATEDPPAHHAAADDLDRWRPPAS